MITYLIGQEEVAAYLRDFLKRLERFNPIPEVWCPLTGSGTELLRAMLSLVRDHHAELAPRVTIVPVGVKGEGKKRKLRFLDETKGRILKGQSVLVFDGAVHSGQLMSDCVRKVLDAGAKRVCTYSLIIKRSTRFVPTIWGVTVDDVDRAFFLLNAIPNNRLDARSPCGKETTNIPFIHMRALDKEDTPKRRVISGVESIDRVTWADRHFDMKAGDDKRCCYLLEEGKKIVGFLTLSRPDAATLAVDEVAVDRRQQGKKYGAVLMRFADSTARSHNCRYVKLHGITDVVDMYKKFGYVQLPGEALRLAKEEYLPMQKTVVYNPSWLE